MTTEEEKRKLKDEARVEYLEIAQSAHADYEKIKDSAFVEYLKIEQPAFAKFQKKLEEIEEMK